MASWDCVFVWRWAPLALRFGGRRATAGWSRDRHVAVALPSWGEAVALWVVALAFARNEHPLGRFAHRTTLDVVFGPNTLHHI